ncbi:uncharacterized protein LOC110463673 isoform X2 [Mizuhopecten yessoensis]|uniref:Tyrosinase-like protein 1 n=1 Tax=Mizuhopecten yessoensis TaxID=6573 RepID=A0A210R2R4_MIZYE|nr:uncharacterized protein LOC110463673 isoform X1 [Mizuhopecten yessoensis]XP_021374156.1 uncharacterized protein LOC110463673 isoform X2 [Mizuhopecten yessoensis]OWF55161.1 Tyrosinase-like protein 1 [Mizuhopecten yessoensis]
MAGKRHAAGLITFFLTTCSFAVIEVTGFVEEIPMPRELEECYKFRTQNISIMDLPSEDINMFCINQFLYSTTYLRPQRTIANESILYAQELMRQVLGEYHEYQSVSRRYKRQVQGLPLIGVPQGIGQGSVAIPGSVLLPTLGLEQGIGRIPGLGRGQGIGRIPGVGSGPGVRPRGRRLIRREVRTLSRREWVDFVNRINQLKRTPVGPTNQYDALADIHRMVVTQAHNGPNFLGWHSVYLSLLEQAIGMAVPYWDSRIDFYMRNPVESILWTDAFFGPGYGEIRSGPFANWVTPTGTPLIRNIGSTGSLISEAMVRNVLSQVDINAVTEPSAGPFTIERIHNGPHVWVDGQFSAPLTASYDPIFFLHHSFSDYVWRLFRRRQRAAGINPALAYPRSLDPNQAPGARMVPFNYRCIDGYSEYFERRVIYAPPPRCPYCGTHAVCRGGRCVSRRGARPRIPRRPGLLGSLFSSPTSPTSNSAASSFGPKFQSDFQDPRNNRAKRHAISALNEQVLNNDTTLINRPYQNTFELNGVSNIDLWAFVPVKIIFERPPQLHFDSYPIKNGSVSRAYDMFTPSKVENVNENNKRQATYRDCHISGSGAAKVYVQTDGIDYSGRYKDYAIVDERQAISSTMTYIGVKSPKDGAAQFYMSAYDTCGRVCRPQCLSDKGYKPCSGAFRVTSSFPKMYGLSYEDAIKRNWKKDGRLTTEPNKAEIPVIFLCDVQPTWPWS